MDRERIADGEQGAGRDSPRVRRDLLFPRVIVEFAKRVQARLFPQTLPQLKTLRKGDRKAALLVNPYY